MRGRVRKSLPGVAEAYQAVDFAAARLIAIVDNDLIRAKITANTMSNTLYCRGNAPNGGPSDVIKMDTKKNVGWSTKRVEVSASVLMWCSI